jgi:tRNA nucleotidyltransferase/poly(A) polymerase
MSWELVATSPSTPEPELKTPQKTAFEDAKMVLQTLLGQGFQAMFAGGCVRDRLLGRIPNDYDIASAATPGQAKAVFESAGFRVIPTGIEHGTITVVSPSGPVEITTLRKDVKTDGRHAIVAFDNATFEDDAQRRDFTINAMFEDIHGKIHDFHGGQQDLQNHHLRFVGDPVKRIREDYLRILRFFRFWSRLDFTPDNLALEAIGTECDGLRHISQERITSELWGIFSAQYSADPLKKMEELAVTKLILPEAITLSHKVQLILRDASNTPENIRPWIVGSIVTGILEDTAPKSDDVVKLARRLRMSEKQAQIWGNIYHGWQQCLSIPRERASALLFAERLEANEHHHNLINFYGPIWQFFSRHEVTGKKGEQFGWIISTDQTFQEQRRMQLPLNGHDITEFRPDLDGKKIGEALTIARRAFLNGQWNSRHDGLQFIKGLDLKNSNRS